MPLNANVGEQCISAILDTETDQNPSRKEKESEQTTQEPAFLEHRDEPVRC